LIEKDKFAGYLWMAPFYFVSVGVLYLWGYWPNFRINIFEYVSLSDVVKVAIVPVGSVFIFVLLGFCIGEASVGGILPEGGGKGTRLGRFLNRIKKWLILLYVAVIYFFIFYPIPNKWVILPVLLIWPFYLPLKHSGFLKEVANDSVRSVLIIAIIALPLWSYAAGKINADKILKGSNCQYAEVGKDGEKQKLKFLGFANQYVFFLSMNNEDVVVARIDDLSPLYLHLLKPKK
jgi:hypothetical protein